MTVKVTKPAINVREELADLRKPSGVAGEAMLRAETPQEQFNLIGAGRRNLLLNGSHIVNQRNNLPTSGTSGGYPATDRWKYYSTTTSCSLSLSSVTLPDGTAANSLKAESTTSGTHAFDWYQKVEPINYAHLDGQTVTMSCWVRSNSSNARLMLWQGGGAKGQTPYTGNGEWQYLTVSGVVDASAAILEAYAAIGTETNLSGVAVTSGEYIEFTRCQLEVGKVATPFEHRSYGEELAACQRYYERLVQAGDGYNAICVSVGLGSQYAYGVLDFKTTKRAAPTMSYDGDFRLLGAPNIGGITTLGEFYNPQIDKVRMRSDTGGTNLTNSNAYVLEFSGANSISGGYIAADAEL